MKVLFFLVLREAFLYRVGACRLRFLDTRSLRLSRSKASTNNRLPLKSVLFYLLAILLELDKCQLVQRGREMAVSEPFLCRRRSFFLGIAIPRIDCAIEVFG